MIDPKLSREAAQLQAELLLGFCEVAHAIAWADEQIAAETAPEPSLIELAYTPPDAKYDAIRWLESLSKKEEMYACCRTLLSKPDFVDGLDFASGDRLLSRLRQIFPVFGPDPEDLKRLVWLDEGFVLAEEGIISQEQALRELKDGLRGLDTSG